MKIKKFILPAAAVLAAALASPAEARSRTGAELRHPSARVISGHARSMPGHFRQGVRVGPGSFNSSFFVFQYGGIPYEGYAMGGMWYPFEQMGMNPNMARPMLPSGAYPKAYPPCDPRSRRLMRGYNAMAPPELEPEPPQGNDSQELSEENAELRQRIEALERRGERTEPAIAGKKPVHVFNYDKCTARNQYPAEAKDFINDYLRAIGIFDMRAYILGFGSSQYVGVKKNGKVEYEVRFNGFGPHATMDDFVSYLFTTAAGKHKVQPSDVMDFEYTRDNDPETCPVSYRR